MLKSISLQHISYHSFSFKDFSKVQNTYLKKGAIDKYSKFYIVWKHCLKKLNMKKNNI